MKFSYIKPRSAFGTAIAVAIDTRVEKRKKEKERERGTKGGEGSTWLRTNSQSVMGLVCFFNKRYAVFERYICGQPQPFSVFQPPIFGLAADEMPRFVRILGYKPLLS